MTYRTIGNSRHVLREISRFTITREHANQYKCTVSLHEIFHASVKKRRREKFALIYINQSKLEPQPQTLAKNNEDQFNNKTRMPFSRRRTIRVAHKSQKHLQ